MVRVKLAGAFLMAIGVLAATGSLGLGKGPDEKPIFLFPVIEQDFRGQFVTDVRVNGRRVEMLIDTGASVVALTYKDARKLRVLPDDDAFVIPVSTANGTTYAAPIMLEEVSVKSADARNVRALILPRGASDKSLLGMTYLSQLKSFQVRDGKLVLRD